MSETFLQKIVRNKRERLDRMRPLTDLSQLKADARRRREGRPDHHLRKALSDRQKTNIIAEIKRASPSRGTIRSGVNVAELAESYRSGGAAAISVLTEEDFFGGSLQDLKAVRDVVDIPILRKDFIVDELQVYEAAAAGADAVLLIVAALRPDELIRLLRIAENDLGMDAVVEVHTANELDAAALSEARIIGVNNRDLASFTVSLDVSRELIKRRPGNSLMITESGLKTRADVAELAAIGFDGFLIGESLMRSRDPAAMLKELCGESR